MIFLLYHLALNSFITLMQHKILRTYSNAIAPDHPLKQQLINSNNKKWNKLLKFKELKVLYADSISISSLHRLQTNVYLLLCENFALVNIDKPSHGYLKVLSSSFSTPVECVFCGCITILLFCRQICGDWGAYTHSTIIRNVELGSGCKKKIDAHWDLFN